MRDPYRYFRIEARELKERLMGCVLALEREGASPERFAQLLRDAHTLKGAARVVKLPEIADLAHEFEGLASELRAGRAEALPELLERLDRIGARLEGLESPESGPEAGAERFPGGQAPAPQVEAVRVDLEEVDTLVQQLTELSARFTSLRRVADRVVPSAAAGARELASALDQLERELLEAQERSQRLRLVPVTAIVPALERAIRDSAQVEGRKVALDVKGSEVRLDSHVLAQVASALLHVARNSVTHGIEPPAERRRLGKPEVGAVRLRVDRAGDRMRFRLEDDGAGVDVERVRARAIETGLASPDELQRMSEDELVRLTLRPGFSTAAQVNEVAGRGVGLDAAAEAVRKVGGTLAIRSVRGSRFEVEIQVPISLSSLAVLDVRAGGAVHSLPLSSVRRTARTSAAELREGGSGRVLVHGDRAVPFVPLAEALPGAAGSPDAAESPGRWSVVIVSCGEGAGGERLLALGVDRTIGAREVVARPLPPLTPRLRHVAGVTLGNDGEPQVILEPAGLLPAVARRSAAAAARPRRKPRALVVDDSLTSRMLEKRVLEAAGLEVDLAESAEEALGQARKQEYGIFLVDVEMPGMNGFELLQAIRKDPALREIPAILITSLSSPESRRKGMESGAQGYLVKSDFSAERLLAMIRNLTGWSR